MKFANKEWLRVDIWLGLCLVWTLMSWMASGQGITTTTVQGTVYLANGQAGSGTLQVSWPAFTTASSQAVAAGHVNFTIGSDGYVSVNLAPNQGATPAGLYYTAIYHLNDGTTSTEYWVVPAAAQANLAQVRAQLMPAAQAVQAVSKGYVDQSIQELTQSLLTASGGSLSGPLYLNGDPTSPTQAANKHYVDTEFSMAVPVSGGVMTGPLTSVQLGAAYQVDQFAGADYGARLQACLNQLNATYGGTCDARNFTGTLAMGSTLTIATGNATVQLPCATVSTSKQIVIAAGTRNVALHGCALRGASTASGSQGGTVFLYSGSGAMIQVGDPTYAADTAGFHIDNAVINTTAASNSTAQGLAAYRTQELDLASLYLLGNSNQTGITLDGTGNYSGGTFQDIEISGFGTAVSGIGHQIANGATTDWLNASAFLRLHIDCPTNNGNPISGTYGINLLQGDGNTFTGGDVEGCGTALHLGSNAQNNTIVGLRNENSINQVVADTGSSYNNWMTGGTMFTGQLTDNGTRNSFLDTFHRSFNGLNGDWYGSQQDATITNHYRIGTGAGNERGLLNRYQTDSGYRWTNGFSDATAGEQFYQLLDELNNVYRLSIGQYNNGQANTNNQTVINAAGSGAVVLNGSSNAGTGGVVFGAGGSTGAAVGSVSNTGNAQFNGSLSIGGSSTFGNSTTVKNQADAEIDSFLWAGATANQKESYIYKDYLGASQWYMVKDASNNWALNSAIGSLDSFKAYQSTNSGDTYINASNATGHIRLNYESGAGSETDIYSGSSSALVAAFLGTTAIKFPGLAAGSGHSCLQIDNSGYITNTGTICGAGTGTVNAGTTGQVAYYTSNGTAIAGTTSVAVTAGGTGASTAAQAVQNLGAQTAVPGLAPDGASGATLTGNFSAKSFNGSVNKVLNVLAYGAKCDGVTNDQSAIQNAFNDALTNGYSVQFPPGTCLTSVISWSGQSFFGAGQGLTTIQGKPGAPDVFEGPDPNGPATTAWPVQPTSFKYPQTVEIHDLTILVDTSVDASAAPTWGNNTFPNRITGTYGGTTPIPAQYGGPPAPGGIYIYGGPLPSGSTSITTLGTNGGYLFNYAPSAMVIGQPITIAGAGVAGAAYTGTITGITNYTTVTVSPATSTTVSSWTGAFGNPPQAPWYIGACAVAVPNSDINHQPSGVNHWKFSNLTLGASGTSLAWNGHTCGFFMQAGSYDMHESHVTYTSTYGGHIEAPAANATFAGYAQSPDTSSYDDLNFSGLYVPVTTYGGMHRRWNGISLYTGGLFELGFYNFTTLDTSTSNYFSEYYDEPLQFNQGEHARFSGTVDIKSGSLMQTPGIGTFYTNFFTSGSTVNAVDSAGLVINGNYNTFTNMGGLSLGVVDNGLGNSVSYTPAYTSASAFAHPVRAQANNLSTDFLRGGNVNGDWYTSISDMFLTPDIFNDTAVPFTIVNDPNAPLTGRYAAIPSTGFGMFHYLGSPTGWVAGSNFARSKGVFEVMAKALTTNTTMSIQLYVVSPYSALVTLSCPFAAGTYSLCSGAYDASGVAAGRSIAIGAYSTSPATEADIAWMAAVPDASSLRVGGTAITASLIASLQSGSSLAQTTPATLLSAANWSFATGTTSVDATSPTGYSTTFSTASGNLSTVGGDSNLTGGHLYDASGPSVVTVWAQAPVVWTDTLAAAQTSSATTLTLTTPTTSAWPASGLLQMDDEIESYSGVTAGQTSITVTRGTNGTLAQSHANGVSYNSVGQGTLYVSCNSVVYSYAALLFTPKWSSYSAPFAGQNCSGYSTTVNMIANVGITGQQFKLASIAFTRVANLSSPTAANQVPMSTAYGTMFSYQSNKAIAGSGAGLVSGPTSGTVANHGACYNDTAGTAKDCGYAPVNPTAMPLSGTTASWNNSGSAIAANSCVNGPTVSITGATTSMGIVVTPAANPGLGLRWNEAYISSGTTVQVVLCNVTAAAVTPAATAYNIRVIQ